MWELWGILHQMKTSKVEIHVIWLDINGCYAVAFGDQLLPINGRVLFAYKWQLEEALEAVSLICVDFEGSGIIIAKQVDN